MLKDSFCSSPWFHLRLTRDGSYQECRWSNNIAIRDDSSNIKNTSLLEYYNSTRMRSLRTSLLNGEKPELCQTCYYQDSFNKVSGRIKQLHKSAVNLENFDLTLRASSHFKIFDHSNNNDGHSDYFPVDLQIDLGNICNSACIMCDPFSSSQLSADYIKLNKTAPSLFKKPIKFSTWTKDPLLVDKFVNELDQIPNLKYIHFLGGETLYDPAFYNICERLIDSGKSKDIIVGTTTNGTIYDTRVESLLSNFKEFHLGVSIESVTKLNDYIRYPGKIDSILSNLDKFLSLRNNVNLQISLRITPNIFTINEYDLLVDYMIEKNVISESCNILYNPACLKMELMPDDMRHDIIQRLDDRIQKYSLTKSNIVNIRRKDVVSSVISDNVLEYKNFLENYKVPDNVETLRYQLVDFLKSFESIRKNSILNYAPKYKQFLRSYGY